MVNLKLNEWPDKDYHTIMKRQVKELNFFKQGQFSKSQDTQIDTFLIWKGKIDTYNTLETCDLFILVTSLIIILRRKNLHEK